MRHTHTHVARQGVTVDGKHRSNIFVWIVIQFWLQISTFFDLMLLLFQLVSMVLESRVYA